MRSSPSCRSGQRGEFSSGCRWKIRPWVAQNKNEEIFYAHYLRTPRFQQLELRPLRREIRGEATSADTPLRLTILSCTCHMSCCTTAAHGRIQTRLNLFYILKLLAAFLSYTTCQRRDRFLRSQAMSRSNTVLSDCAFPSNAVATKFAPHCRQGSCWLTWPIELSVSPSAYNR
jgi:hypothetical protein